MPINKRLSKDTQLIEVDDNVIAQPDRANDSRGVFDPRKDPLEGSSYEHFPEDPNTRGSVMGFIGYIASELGESPRGEELTVQDALAQVRTNRNTCNIESRYRNRIVSPLSGVRAFCVVECQSGSVKAVGQCTCMDCPLWAFRMGTNGLRGKQ